MRVAQERQEARSTRDNEPAEKRIEIARLADGWKNTSRCLRADALMAYGRRAHDHRDSLRKDDTKYDITYRLVT